ncbi:MAG: SpoVA/SpoVAEb family sporulation membrane protein [Ruminococcus sp.]|jgi:stage V sporulation protein AC|nr:SpoVA/SpoVAEb family sporulation membrane protein [Ruminococcus sp.]MBQ1453227.1 SpoVA/SpoVAEb family sporulation membrane protein [Ruminococcus sp.]MBQ1902799.1 SpoVA/SpoVAEb family sporulation membrane protein [Ruminococcus sp.]MBQ3935538.1 SpoVA/SpoVAEb family sporulation membrane protein [Ruminococcus sp.]MBQ9869199.1 SpoVA/SpoVAEb family sporulation membrane protein [Ruminococcus sp.]
MDISKQQYEKMYKQASKGTKWYVTTPKAFFFGGLICLLGQSLLDLYRSLGLEQKTASLAVSVTLIFLSAFFTALGWYEKLAKHAGAGTLVPITGFANSVAAPALEFKTEGWILGLGAKIFIISGPVILYGTLASIAYGLIYYLLT